MKKIVLILVIMFSTGLVIESNAQANKEQRKIEKAEKKATKLKVVSNNSFLSKNKENK